MGDKTAIQWTDATWNPVVAYANGKRGWMCTKPSDGCKNCYAERLNKVYGNGLDYTHKNADAVEWRLANLEQPLKWKKPRRIFVESMSDLFHEKVPDEFIDRVFKVMQSARHHAFQVLTKRPERMRDFLKNKVSVPWGGYSFPDPWGKHIWLGTSIENQKTADERIPLLLQTLAAIRWISVEPMLGPVDLRALNGLDWVVIGGESGSKARPFNVQWARDIISQCRVAGIPVFIKQLGSKPGFKLEDEERQGNLMPGFHHSETGLYIKRLRDSHGGDMSEWPTELRIREYPI